MRVDSRSLAAEGPVSLSLKLFYGSGQAVDSVIQAAVNTFLLFYLTAVCGLSGSAAGSVFLLSLVIDALADPFIGRLSDNWRSRWGRRLPFMVGALSPMAAAAYLMFSLPSSISQFALFADVLMLNITLRVGLSVFALPHSALTAELTHDYAERSVISVFRALFIVLGTGAILVPAFAFIFSGPAGLQSRAAYPYLGLLTAALILAFGVSCLAGTYRRVVRLPVPERVEGAAPTSFLADLLQLFRNPSFVPMFGAAVVVLVGQGAVGALNLHAFHYFWRVPDAFIQLPLLLLPVGMLIGTLLAGMVLKRIEKRDGVLGAVIVLGLFQIAAPLLVVAGAIVPGSTASIVAVALDGLLFGGGGAMCFVCFYSMIADAVDEHDHLFGVRREALYAAALMIGAKAATGLGAFLAGLGLQLIGFSTPATPSDMVPAKVAAGLGLLWGPGAAALILLSIPFLRRYRLGRARHGQIIDWLGARNEASPATRPAMLTNVAAG